MALVALFSLGFAVFQQFYEKKPDVLIKTEAISAVFSVLQSVGGLQVSYAGQDLRSSRQALWVISAVISNNGTAVIRKADYDNVTPFSVSVMGGQIVEIPVITSESTYLQESLKPNVVSNRIIFSPVILEPKDSFRLRILVLGPEQSPPSLKAEGKIAGLQAFSYATPDAPYASRSIWQMATQADVFWIQFLRLPIYFLACLIFLIVIGIASAVVAQQASTFRNWRAKRQRLRSISDYRQGENMVWEDRALSEIYIEFGEEALGKIKKLLDKTNKRLILIKQLEPINQNGNFDTLVKHATSFYRSKLLDELEKRKLLLFDGIYPKWASGVPNALQNISTFLSLDLESIAKVVARKDISFEDDGWVSISSEAQRE